MRQIVFIKYRQGDSNTGKDTRDGDELDPKLLGLVELAVNGHLNNGFN
jgi:hypothetical protein